jgi:hypothetical protein
MLSLLAHAIPSNHSSAGDMLRKFARMSQVYEGGHEENTDDTVVPDIASKVLAVS